MLIVPYTNRNEKKELNTFRGTASIFFSFSPYSERRVIHSGKVICTKCTIFLQKYNFTFKQDYEADLKGEPRELTTALYSRIT